MKKPHPCVYIVSSIGPHVCYASKMEAIRAARSQSAGEKTTATVSEIRFQPLTLRNLLAELVNGRNCAEAITEIASFENGRAVTERREP